MFGKASPPFCAGRSDLKVLGQSSDGGEAVELILALKPDFAVLDLNMPKLSGLDVIRRVRQAKSETKLVVLSISRDENVIRGVISQWSEWISIEGWTCQAPV